MCVYMDQWYIHAPSNGQKKTKIIPSWPSHCNLWKIRSKWEICVESVVFVVFQCALQSFWCKIKWKCITFHIRSANFHGYTMIRTWWISCVWQGPFTHTCTTKYHQNISIPNWPSLCILGVNTGYTMIKSVLNQLFLLFFRSFSMCFSWKVHHFWYKLSTNGLERNQNYISMGTHMYHLHLHAQSFWKDSIGYHQNDKIYLVGNPSVLYKTGGHNKRSVWNQLFLMLFSAFHRKCWFSYKRSQLGTLKTNKIRSICVYDKESFMGTCTTTYQNKKIYLVGLPYVLYERPGQNERSVLYQLFLMFFRCFSFLFMVLFMKGVTTLGTKSATFYEKKNWTRSLCVYDKYHLHIHASFSPPNTTKI